ncbi:hypothetical protein DRW41_07830 [Neobacillus piezotolerans]|uniref:DUF421 domain-containing protein n=1 Tax=Neobacillus piezotolerans TaxID=2259171 RepID=A0A3D8GU50_9BACI|nr:YetF domain-containing protein [Neobacillus piezotolerans]RDU37729.1 hypothetical protein DRW41_07830 [Neobacillus piezotolerans]
MDFYQMDETLSTLEWILRAVVGFVFLVVVAKVLGQRAISKLRLLDFVIALVIGNIIAHPLSDHHLSMKGSLITTIVLVSLYSLGIFLLLKWPWFRRLVSHAPITLIENGGILYPGLKQARISLDVLLEEMRENKIEDVKKVALAIWEADGRISFFLDPQHEPVTPATLKIGTEPFFLPGVIVKEGKLNFEELKRIGKDEEWVRSTMKRNYQADVADILLATVDRNDQVSIFLYK